jgi:hypothetical protein
MPPPPPHAAPPGLIGWLPPRPPPQSSGASAPTLSSSPSSMAPCHRIHHHRHQPPPPNHKFRFVPATNAGLLLFFIAVASVLPAGVHTTHRRAIVSHVHRSKPIKLPLFPSSHHPPTSTLIQDSKA